MKESDIQENIIRGFLKDNLPPERRDPWFTRKVLNRLPPRRRHGNVPEKWAFLLVMLGIVAASVMQGFYISGAPVVYVKDLALMGVLLLLTLVMACWIVAPLIRN